MEWLALLPVVWLVVWLMSRGSATTSRRRDKCVDVVYDWMKEIDEEIMPVHVVKDQRTKNLCAATFNQRNKKGSSFDSKDPLKLRDMVLDEYERVKNNL